MEASHPILLFDFDGVILTHKALEYTALYYIKKGYLENVNGTRLIDFARFFEESDASDSFSDSIKMISKAYKPYIPNKIKRFIFFAKFGNRYKKFEKLYEQLKENLRDTLFIFKKKGYILGIVSNTSKKRISYFRKKFSLDDFFSVYITRDDVPLKKPHPYPIILALKRIKDKFKLKNINKNEVFFFGDLPTDIRCGNAAGINTVALLTGHGTESQLKEAKPTIILEDIRDILKIERFKKYLRQ